MGRWVQDCYGGFTLENPPVDNSVVMRFQGVGPLRQAVGPDIGVTHIVLTVDADAFFNVNDVIAFSIKTPQETFDTINALYDDTYTIVPINFINGRWPAILDAGPGVGVTPDTGKSLTFMPSWALVWLVKTDSNTYTLFGDLVAA